MRNTTINVDGALSINGNISDDGSTGFSTDDTQSDGRDRREKSRRHRRRGDGGIDNDRVRRHRERRGSVEKKIFSPVVFVLLSGVLLSLLDILYIMKHLDESSPEVISTITLGGIQSHNTDKNNNSNNINSIHNVLAGREPIIKLITDAGISFDPVKDADLIEELPLWSEVTDMYGTGPVLFGLDEGNCQRFQTQSDQGDHFLGTAGTFNTGTNLLSELLIANCMMPSFVKIS